MLRSRLFWSVAATVLVAGGIVACSATASTPTTQTDEPALQTATVRRGDIVIFASGTGNLMPAAELNLGFRTGGTLVDLPVAVGDEVRAGDVLARLDDTSARQQVAQAKLNLESAQIKLESAESSAAGAGDPNRLTSNRISLEQAQEALADAQSTYDAAFDPARDWELGDPRLASRLEAERASAQRALEKAQDNLTVAQAQYNLTASSITNEASSAGSNLRSAQLAVEQAQLSLESARQTLSNTVLLAPIDGTLAAIDADVAEAVGTQSILALIDLSQPLVRFWVEETDLDKVAIGNRVTVVFEALPDEAFTGEIVRVDPALVTVSNTPAVQAWAAIDVSSSPATLLSGMNAEVDVFAAEARNVLLAPLQALRELSPGSYAVFVVLPGGELELRPVEVGLKDFANAQILSGLQAGDVVSTGTVDTSDQ